MLNDFPKNDDLCPIESCFHFARTHGVGKATLLGWAKKGYLKEAYRVVDSRGRKFYVVSPKEVKHLVLTQTAIGSIEHLFSIIWTEKLERMVHQSMNISRKKWDYFFDSALPAYQKNIESCDAFFSLCPKPIFFKEHSNIIKRVPKKYQNIYLELVARNRLAEKDKSNDVKFKILDLITKKDACTIVKRNGVSFAWFYKQIRNKTLFAVKYKTKNDSAFLLDKEQLEKEIVASLKVETIQDLLTKVWSYAFAEKMASLKHDEWKKCFSNAREKNVLSYVDARDFFVLRPTYYFFKVHMSTIVSFLPAHSEKKFVSLMNEVERKGKEIVAINFQSYKYERKMYDIYSEEEDFKTVNKNTPNYEYILQGIYNYLVYEKNDIDAIYKELYKKSFAKSLTKRKQEITFNDLNENKILEQESCAFTHLNCPEACMINQKKDEYISNFIDTVELDEEEKRIFELLYDGYTESEIVTMLKLGKKYDIGTAVKLIREKMQAKYMKDAELHEIY